MALALWACLGGVNAYAQRVVVVCLGGQEVATVVSQAASLPGAQALLMSRVAVPTERLSLDQWERSAYLTLNAGARAFAPEPPPPLYTQVIDRLRHHNQRWGYRVEIGLLPDALAAKGVRVYYLTSANDSPMLLAGVPLTSPYVWRLADLPSRWRQAEQVLKQNSRVLLWVDARGVAFERVEGAIGSLRVQLRHGGDALYLLMPISSAQEADKGFRSGWVMRVGGEKGLLWSPSTRLAGYITLPDLTATLLAHFGTGEGRHTFGSVVSTRYHPKPAEATQRLYDSLQRQVWWGRHVGTLPTLQLLCLGIAWGMWRWRGRMVRALWLFPLLVPLLGVLLAPLLILLPLWGMPLPGRAAVWAVAVVVLLGWLSRWPLCRSVRMVATLLTIIVGISLIGGGGLLRWSGFGYIVQEGARFYGLGNETAGSLLGAQSIFVQETTTRALLRWGAVAVAVGAPFWGANTGALLASVAVGMSALARSRRWFWGAGALALVVMALWVYELLSPEPTHLGRFLQSPEGWASTVGRKVQMNLRLLWSSAWSPLWLVGLLGLRGAPRLVWVGAAAMFVFNDSGIVASATMLVWWWVWRVAQQEESESDK